MPFFVVNSWQWTVIKLAIAWLSSCSPPPLLNESLQKRWQSKKSKREAGMKKKWDETMEAVILTFCPGESEHVNRDRIQVLARWRPPKLRMKGREVGAATEAGCVQKSESASPLVTESVKYRQIKATKTTKGCTSPFFVVSVQRSQQLWHCARISQSQFASFIWDPLLVE